MFSSFATCQWRRLQHPQGHLFLSERTRLLCLRTGKKKGTNADAFVAAGGEQARTLIRTPKVRLSKGVVYGFQVVI
jgi:hypothetical protein